MSRRVLIVAAVAIVVAGAAVYMLRPQRGAPSGAPTLDEMARSIGTSIMRNLHRGHVPGRSGEIMTVPRPHRYFAGAWDLRTLATDAPVTTSSHPNPWAYTARVPIVLYGPGYVERGREVDEPVDVAGIAPTYARLLKMRGFRSDAAALPEVAEPCRPPGAACAGRPRPKVIVTVVIDGGGWNVLQQHPGQWPTIARLMREGTLYTNATIGSAPSITGAIHATIGTGDYPVTHGIPGNQLRDPEGNNEDAYRENADPSFLRSATVSELWDEAQGNRPWVGTVSYEGWHLGMIGHGAERRGGDRDVAVLWEPDPDDDEEEEDEWWVNEDFYELPTYLETTDLQRLHAYEEALDERDGLADGTWFGHTLDELQVPTVRPGTPAFVRFTGDAILDVLANEPIGDDELTDLFWIEMKMPDYAGHAWNMLRPEEGDVLLETDRQIARVVAWLDDNIGRNGYVLGITADHGQQPLPELFGGWRINGKELERDVEERFGAAIIEKVTTVDLFMDNDLVEQEGVDLANVARFLATYTIGDNIADAQPGAGLVPEDRLDERLFAGAFPTGYLRDLTEDEIASFGDGDYPEGDLDVRSPGG
ncbi:MAG TPA: alkaline phosphatase family protein [Actinomycetota bacterium]|nr:alkaline phosphatase family protein [Actinomycetota bacterium]